MYSLLSIWGCTTEVNLDRIQRIQNLLARIVCNNFDYINFCAIEMMLTLKLQTIRENRDYFLCISMLKCIHGLAPHYLCNDVTMYVNINGYDKRNAENMDLYLPRCTKETYKRSFLYKCGFLWNQLPSCLKETNRLLISNVITDFYMMEDFPSFWCLCVHVIYLTWNLVMLAIYYVRISASHIYFSPGLLFI